MEWTGSIELTGERRLTNITLSAKNDSLPLTSSDETCLRFLSVIDISNIPLYLTIGSPCTVFTSSPDTEAWFRDIFTNESPKHDQVPWWEGASRDSPLGVILEVPASRNPSRSSGPRVTELLFYASKNGNFIDVPPSPCPSSPTRKATRASDTKFQATFGVNAIALSSDLLHHAQSTEPTPPASPVAGTTEFDAYFWPHPFAIEAEVTNEPPVRKRKSATEVFDQASERYKKARRKGGEGVSAAASNKTDSQVSTLRNRRNSSYSQSVPLQTRPLSRSPSITSRPPTAAAQGPRQSTLSRVQSVTAIANAPDIETKNKDIVSRIVMAGMRLYGLSQSKSRKSRAGSSAPSPAIDATFAEVEAERRNDEEFKLIYHQAFKGTCFVFRSTIAERSLQPFSEDIRDVADKLLAIFCGDPVTVRFEAGSEAVTPAGRKAFGSFVR